MDTIPEALTNTTEGDITVGNLAQSMGVSSDRLRPLVEQGYLSVVIPNQNFSEVVVACPGKSAFAWLSNMFKPFRMRPLIPLKEAGKLWGISEPVVMKCCYIGDIPVHSDPVFGELITFGSLKRLARARASYKKPAGFSRAYLLRYFLSRIEGERWKDPPPYSKRLEAEIRRVTRLREPVRTIRCEALLSAFKDAKTATECLRRGREMPEELRRTEKHLCRLLKLCTGEELKDLGC